MFHFLLSRKRRNVQEVTFPSAPQSPADKTQKIHAGDEVVQVNKQIVVSHMTRREALSLAYGMS